jgi:RecJ-like exonuclease
VTVEGTITTVRVDPTAGGWLLECILNDGTGALSLAFSGRRHIGGIDVGARLRAEGTVAEHRGRLTIFNPVYTLVIARG